MTHRPSSLQYLPQCTLRCPIEGKCQRGNVLACYPNFSRIWVEQSSSRTNSHPSLQYYVTRIIIHADYWKLWTRFAAVHGQFDYYYAYGGRSHAMASPFSLFSKLSLCMCPELTVSRKPLKTIAALLQLTNASRSVVRAFYND